MENTITYDQLVQKYDAFLAENSDHFIRLKNPAKDEFLTFASGREGSYVTKESVMKNHQSFGGFLDHIILSNSLNEIWLYFKVKMGASSRPAMEPQKLNVAPRLELLKSQSAHTDNAMTEKQTPPAVTGGHPNQYPQYYPETQMPKMMPHNEFERRAMLSMGGLGAAALSAGAGMGEFVELKKQAEMSGHWKEQAEFYKKKYDELDITNRKLEAEKQIAEKEKEIAIKSTQLDQKSWTDPEILSGALEKLAPVLTAMVNRTNPEASQQLGVGSPGNLSETKERFMGFLLDEEMTDETVLILEATLGMLTHRPEFKIALQGLIKNNMENAPTGS
ncbi:MAG: hypothetical protein AAGF96_18865 [Bacteroidota bacterium]